MTMIAFLGACAVDAPELIAVETLAVEAAPGQGSAADLEAVRNPRCAEHYTCCMESDLSKVWDGYNQTRCDTCQRLCWQNRLWPYYTPGGDDCQWWQERYGQPRGMCTRLRP